MTTTTDTQSLTPDRKLELEQLAQQALAGGESVSLPPAKLIALLAELQHLRSEPAAPAAEPGSTNRDGDVD